MAATMPRKRVRIGDLLVEQKMISEAQLQQALAEQKKSGRKLGRVLVESGFVDEDKLLQLLSDQLDMPYVNLTRRPMRAAIARLCSKKHLTACWWGWAIQPTSSPSMSSCVFSRDRCRLPVSRKATCCKT